MSDTLLALMLLAQSPDASKVQPQKEPVIIVQPSANAPSVIVQPGANAPVIQSVIVPESAPLLPSTLAPPLLPQYQRVCGPNGCTLVPSTTAPTRIIRRR